MDVKDLIKDSVRIVDVVSRLSCSEWHGEKPLKRSGSHLIGKCPSHGGSGGSFAVFTRTDSFCCYSPKCSVTGGDIISLVELVNGTDFRDSLRWLAENFRPDLLPELERYKQDTRPEVREFYEKAHLYEMVFGWGKELLYGEDGKQVLDYLVERRRYDVENLKKTEWFYFPEDRDIRKHLLSKYPKGKDAIDNLNLQGHLGDTIRLACPYRDRGGSITGFIKRNTDPKAKPKDRWDYTAGLKKADLFNLHACKKFDHLLIVEGIPDALYLPALGLENIVAIGQGKLSPRHLEGLKAFGVKYVTICFDNDPREDGTFQGIGNTEQAIDLLENTDITAFVVDPPLLSPHKDPDEYVRDKGIDAFVGLVKNAQRGVVWKANRIISRHELKTDIGNQKAIDEVIEYGGGLRNPVDQEQFKAAIRDGLDIPESVLEDLTQDYRERKAQEQFRHSLQDFFRDGQRLLQEGKLAAIRELFDEKARDLKAKAGIKALSCYGLDELIRDIIKTPEGLKTGYEELDKVFSIPQEAITIIAGRPSHGKTTFLLNLFLNMVRKYEDKAFFFFSYEQTRKQIGLWVLNMLSRETISDGSQNLLQLERYVKGGHTERAQIEKGKERLKTYTDTNRLWLIDEPYFVHDLVETLAYLKENYPVGAVFIDYIQKVKIAGQSYSRQIEIQRVSQQLLEGALDLSLPIILGAQLGRPASKAPGSYKKENIVRIDNIREAGDIEQDAAAMLGLWNEYKGKEEGGGEEDDILKREYSTVDLTVKVLKNRTGSTGDSIPLLFELPILRIESA